MSKELDLDVLAEMLMLKTSHYLITMMGQTADEANIDEFYRALCYAMREETMINWLATARTNQKFDARQLFYLSMEYLPGRLFTNNIINTNSLDVVRMVMHKMNRSFTDVMFREEDPGLGNGGLGRLASCFLDSLATHHYPSRAYGLRYQYGTFEQQLWDGIQMEAPDCWLIRENPWEFRKDLRKLKVRFCGIAQSDTNIHGDAIEELYDAEEVFALPYDFPIIGYSKDQKFSTVTLRLWTTNESPRNFQLQRYHAGRLDQAAENTTLTDVLYPSDYHDVGKRVRLKQEFLLVSASLQDIIRHYLENHENFRAFADKVRIQINDTHPAMAVAELMRLLTKQYDLPWKRAFEITEAVMGYTNHTILSEALEVWDVQLYKYLLPRQYTIIERLNHDLCGAIRKKYPNDEGRVRRMSIIENGKIHMSHLAIYGSHKVNGVAALHTDIVKKSVFKDFYEFTPEKFVNVTNGVTQRRWLLECNQDLAKFVTRRIGDEWITDFTQIKRIAEYAADPDSQRELMEIKLKNKERFANYILRKGKTHDVHGQPVIDPPIINPNTLFDVQIKRIHEYKRQLMNALHILMLYFEMRDNPDHGRVSRTCIFSGKAAASYATAKNIILFINCIARKINSDPDVRDFLKVVFVENYNVTAAEVIIPATDLSEQISTAGMEASGTGNMKLTINGALTIGTDDGANVEMREHVSDEWWPFKFGLSSDEVEALRATGHYRSWEICAENEKIKRAVDSLRDGSLAINDIEERALNSLYHGLIDGEFGHSPDRFYVLKDLEDFYQTQKRVEELYRKPKIWAEYVLHNIAGMGSFSSDTSIKNYAEKIWEIEPLPIDEEILTRVREEYSKHDKCRIYI